MESADRQHLTHLPPMPDYEATETDRFLPHDDDAKVVVEEGSPHDAEKRPDAERPLVSRQKKSAQCCQCWTRERIAIAVALILSGICWLVLLGLYTTSSTRKIDAVQAQIKGAAPPKPATLDTAYRSTADFDLVVSAYKEDADTVAHTLSRILSIPAVASAGDHLRIWIYSKDEQFNKYQLLAAFSNLTAIKGNTELNIIARPNVGREGETYLHHILTQWSNLARHTLFTQAGIDDLGEFSRRVKDAFTRRTGMLSLSFVSTICDCHDCNDKYWHDTSGVLAKTYEMANHNSTCGWLLLSYKGQFIASAQRIRGSGKEVFEYLHRGMAEENSWAHQPEYLGANSQGTADNMNAPALGYTLERMWYDV